MKKSLFIFGLVLNISGATFSFYPVFQDFDETDYVIPFYKSENYPNYLDLLIMNVNSDCSLSDNIFSQYTMNGEPICDIAKNWVNSLFGVIFVGIVLMMIGAVLPFKIKQKQLNVKSSF